eukprot:CAMPEP_0177168222 /NCGR_PEP_ID=MMETSP0367-20130122/8954_1 /TAXON_ID=447022 ORGANISM="Scrippsiella hangoei-like, Strain SHHI-4" /NCGR_SAMPLE_ID=MMETSP0367 /ASSEMBLY_ACC=CAM_ASM_000362 /LENGTH=81 /DNA_ID=CAMNT_0018614347 /DNA_START=1246 /DNA_END=1487 /DNA_ORIENTATION=-
MASSLETSKSSAASLTTSPCREATSAMVSTSAAKDLRWPPLKSSHSSRSSKPLSALRGDSSTSGETASAPAHTPMDGGGHR